MYPSAVKCVAQSNLSTYRHADPAGPQGQKAETEGVVLGTSRSSVPKLAIILPTYRFDAAAIQALTLAAGIGCDDILVHIGDNSENPEKHAFLRDLATRSVNVVVTCHATNIGAEANWLFLVRSQTAPLICLACDDDSFARRYFSAGISLLMDDAKCAAASGLLLSVASDPKLDVPILYSPPERLEIDPLRRIERYNNQNAIAYALTRVETLRDFATYVEENPLKNAFNDYLLAFHLLSIGTYRLDRDGQVYVYDNDNWHLPHAALETSAKFYASCGLPKAFAHFARLHWAVANAHFFLSRFRHPSLDDRQAEAIAAYLFDRYIKDFRHDMAQNKRAFDSLFTEHPEAAIPVSALIERPYARNRAVFAQFTAVVAAFLPDIAARYDRFLTQTLLPRSSEDVRAPSFRDRLRALIRR